MWLTSTTFSESDVDLQLLLKERCFKCHNEEKHKGDLQLDNLPLPSWPMERWQNVRNMIEADEMPPNQKNLLEPEHKANVIRAIDATTQLYFGKKERASYQKLTRYEIQTSLRHLSKCSLTFLNTLPEDPKIKNFESSDQLLKITPSFLSLWYDLAQQVSQTWIESAPTVSKENIILIPEKMSKKSAFGQAMSPRGWLMYSNDVLQQEIYLPQAGIYRLHVKAWSSPAKGQFAIFKVACQESTSLAILADGSEASPKIHTFDLFINKGEQKLSISFENDAYFPDWPVVEQRDCNLALLSVEIEGKPIQASPWEFSSQHQAFFLNKPKQNNQTWNNQQREQLLTEVCEHWLPIFFSRKISVSEVDSWKALWWEFYSKSQHHENSYQQWLTVILTSHDFLTRKNFEYPLQVNDFETEFIKRCSFAFWGMADERLSSNTFQRTTGPFWDKKEIRKQLEFWQNDPRFVHFMERFFGQWLRINELPLRQIHHESFPNAKPALLKLVKDDFISDCSESWKANRSIVDFLGSHPLKKSESWMVQQLYQSNQHPLAHKTRQGFLSSAAFLMVSSFPHRTSPVRRGKYILENILGEMVPPPPPSAPSFDEAQLKTSTQSFAEQLQSHLHRDDCKSCHQRMDPIGLKFEIYNAMGQLQPNASEDALMSFQRWLGNLTQQEKQINLHFMNNLWIYLTGRNMDPLNQEKSKQLIAAQPSMGQQDIVSELLFLLYSDMKP